MIEVDSLSKRFDAILAVDNLSFKVMPGEVLGFLGPNGAGKSTTMKMLTGFLRPDSGSARICGFDIQQQPLQAKRALGYLPEGAPGYGDMTVLAFLQFIAELRGLRGAAAKLRLEKVIHEVHLEQVLYQSIDTLSKGYRRRVGLAQAILHDPQVLILDEPTDGLDPNQKHEVRRLIANMAKDKIIVVSTHILEEVEAVCTRAMIIAHGRLLVDGTPEQLAARSPYHGAVGVQAQQLGHYLETFSKLPQVANVEMAAHGELILLAKPDSADQLLPAVNALIREHAWQVDAVYQKQGRLDEVFRAITQKGTPLEIAA